MGFHVSTIPGKYSDADTFADLPDVALSLGEVWLVRATTGTIFINRKRAGLYISSGTTWSRLGRIQLAGGSPGYLPSNPPVGKCFVTNVYVDPSTGKLEVLDDDVEKT